jgi:dipeptidyl-peptidase-4
MARPVTRYALLASAWCALIAQPISAQQQVALEPFFNVASPLELVAAKKADRIAWTVYEAGQRNVYTAAAPDFVPLRLTSFLQDNGQEVSGVRLSDDGSIAIFIRGHAPNRQDWVANPMHDPAGSERAIWAARTSGGAAWRLVETSATPVLSPDGRTVLYTKDGQIYRVRTAQNVVRDSMDRGLKPFIRAWGTNSNPVWSPDGSKIAFVSNRGDHSFIGMYDVATRRVFYVSPDVDCDSNPMFSPDGRRIAFFRRPGTPFGRQAQQGTGGIGNPAGAAANSGQQQTCGSGGNAPPNDAALNQRAVPGLYAATLPNGSVYSIMMIDVAEVGDIESPRARVVWAHPREHRTFLNMQRPRWVGDHLVFQMDPPNDEWNRYWSLDLRNPNAQTVLLTTTDGLIEDATSVSFSPDGSTMYYTTNANDIERRHIWAVPVAGGAPVQLSKGDGVETYPQALGGGRNVAVLYFGARTPASVGILPNTGGEARLIYPSLRTFPTAAHVVPEIVWLTAPDGVRFSNQLFLPQNMRPGERRPALVFVHGGPQRQMMPAYHYMQFYHWAYGINQWLANQGYVVLSVNYRRGIGYGDAFRSPPNTQARGNAEYQDVLAAGKYLQTRTDVDPGRVGIWGLSYGGLLTAQALARNSDVFIAGVDMAGVHLYGNALDSTALSYRSSAISQIASWKSPVFLVHGDDDRNVNFAQTVGLVQLLRAHNVYHELIVVPDDVHESMLHSRWIYTWNRMGDFLKKYVWNKGVAAQH